MSVRTKTRRFASSAKPKLPQPLDHPNIGTIQNIPEPGGGHMFIIVAHDDGETQKQKIERAWTGPLKDAVNIATQVAKKVCSHLYKGRQSSGDTRYW